MAFGISKSYYPPDLSITDRMDRVADPLLLEYIGKQIGHRIDLSSLPTIPMFNHNHYLVAVRQCSRHELCVEKMYPSCFLYCVDHEEYSTAIYLKNILKKYL